MNNKLAKEWAEKFFTGFPGGLPELEAAMNNSTALNEEFAETAFSAAEDGFKLSAEWTKEALTDLEQITKTQTEPSELASVLANYTSDAAGKSTQKMAAFAEILGRMQAESIRLFVEASQDSLRSATTKPAGTPKAKAKLAPAATAA